MSDFDKEKEREKLRKKYERDEQKREKTEQMSELLLKGATMTNAHCSECGDPIFRYDGQEFCATCQKPVDRGSNGGQDKEGKNAGNVEVTTPSDDATVVFGEQVPGENAAQAGETGEAKRSNDTGGTPEGSETAEANHETSETAAGSTGAGETSQANRAQVPSVDPQQSRDHATTAGADQGITRARTALVRTLVRFSQQAEATEDPQRAREYLAAAREAGEALATLRN